MKEPQAKGQFQQAVENLRDDKDTKTLLSHLSSIRAAVLELQAEGVTLSLEVRPGASKCPIPLDTRARLVANGTIHIGATDVEFAILGGSSMRFCAYQGNAQIEQKYLSSLDDDNGLKKHVTDIILRIGAQAALLDEFNIDEGGRPGHATGRALAVSPPIRLKNTPKP